jgi:hypothetical protein
MLTQAKTAAGQAVSNMQPINSAAQASQPSSGAQQPNITINLGQGAQSPAAPVPPPPVTHVAQPFAYDPAYGPSPVAPPSPMTRAFGGSDLVLPPIARGYRPVWRQ